MNHVCMYHYACTYIHICHHKYIMHAWTHSYMLAAMHACIPNVIPGNMSYKQAKHVIIDVKEENMAVK